ncbi:MAG: glycosyltransferase [Omnitrophica bacterium]|nr:glycosyltransferase [Candidatus Omnitrophota bacterium]
MKSRRFWRFLTKKYEPWMRFWILRKTLNYTKKEKFFRIIYIATRISLLWYFSVKIRNKFTRKIKIGFGPIVRDRYDLSVQKWRVDPIVDQINKTSSKYSADIFFEPQELAKFDISIIVKEFNSEYYPIIEQQKKQGKMFIFDIVDNPACTEESSLKYHENPDFIRLMDGIIASSPLHVKDMEPFDKSVVLIEHPIINKAHCRYKRRKHLTVIWQGYIGNSGCMKKLRPILKRIQEETQRDIKFVYSTNCESRTEGIIRYVKWKFHHWQKMLAQADIGVVIKPQQDKWQQRKCSNKVVTYMVAGLPVVCTPTESDKLVIQHGKTGYFAYTDQEWYRYLKELIENPELRSVVGKAARTYVMDNFNVKKITDKYITFIEQLRAQ